MLKTFHKRLLCELLKNSRRSDRELAKVLGVSQPTVTRARAKLVNEGLIREFTVIPNFKKMGYELMAITFGKYRAKFMRTPELLEKVGKWLNEHPNIIFASKSEGMGKDALIITLHRNYTEYAQFLQEIRVKYGAFTQDHESIIITMDEPTAKPLSLKGL
ncbi:MAG: Lrp/AsnC family transcriptional regulator [Candidatus Bathyarchaeota archaeon]|nr:MAG: Lrp/AsnC family transcriptional regulator [Candidatus Bathyarchaeota archaeon]